MTNLISAIVSTRVPASALAKAVALVRTQGHDVTPERLNVIAQQHGGDSLMASAISLRLGLLAMLLATEPELDAMAYRISPEALGNVLAELPIRLRAGTVDFSGDALAAGIRLASEPVRNA